MDRIKIGEPKKIEGPVVRYQSLVTTGGHDDLLWFEVDAAHADLLCDDSSPFLAALQNVAWEKGDELVIDGTISLAVKDRLPAILAVWNKWGFLKKGKLSSFHSNIDSGNPTKVATFFSCGVDSFYTLQKHQHEITHLILVHGFDIRLDDVDLFERTKNSAQAVARELGKELLIVRTNVRTFTERYIHWDFAHGAAIAAVALLIRKSFAKVYCASGMSAPNLRPYGSHPELDFLWSSEKMVIVHDGVELERLEKIRALSSWKLAMANLRVCWKNQYGKFNCCRCEKCLRTMIELEALGVLHRAETFPEPIDHKLVKSIYTSKSHLCYYREALKLLNAMQGEESLVAAISEMIYMHEHPAWWGSPIRDFKKWIGHVDARYTKGKLYKFLVMRGLV